MKSIEHFLHIIKEMLLVVSQDWKFHSNRLLMRKRPVTTVHLAYYKTDDNSRITHVATGTSLK